MTRTPMRPFKTLTFILLQETNAVVYSFKGYYRVDTALASRQLKISTHDLRQDLKWLRTKGYLVEAVFERGLALVRPYLPSNKPLIATHRDGEGAMLSPSTSTPKEDMGWNP